MNAHKIQDVTPADPVERARAIVENETKPARTYKGRALKQRREIVACVMEEHVETLEAAVPVGHFARIGHSVSRLRTLMGELKSLEGWTWEFEPGHCYLKPDPIFTLIEECRTGWFETYTAELEAADQMTDVAERERAREEACDRQEARLDAVKETVPTTLAGAAAMARFFVEMEEEFRSAEAGKEFLSALATALEGLASRAVKA